MTPGSADSPPSEHADDHADCSPDRCFTAKVRYWRKHGVSTIIPDDFRAVPRGRE